MMTYFLPNVENDIFWSEVGLGFGEPGGTPPPRIRRSTPRGKSRFVVTERGTEYCHESNNLRLDSYGHSLKLRLYYRL